MELYTHSNHRAKDRLGTSLFHYAGSDIGRHRQDYLVNHNTKNDGRLYIYSTINLRNMMLQ